MNRLYRLLYHFLIILLLLSNLWAGPLFLRQVNGEQPPSAAVLDSLLHHPEALYLSSVNREKELPSPDNKLYKYNSVYLLSEGLSSPNNLISKVPPFVFEPRKHIPLLPIPPPVFL